MLVFYLKKVLQKAIPRRFRLPTNKFSNTNTMSFYNTPDNSDSGPGMYSSGGGMYGQPQQQQPGFSNSNNNNNNMSQWQTQSSTSHQQQQQYPQQQSQGGQSMSYGQAPQQQHDQQSFGQSSFFTGIQQQGSQVASQVFTDFATGNLTGEKIGAKLIDGIGKGFGGGIPGLEYVMGSLRSYFAVDNRYVKRKIVKVLFPFTNKQWYRVVSRFYVSFDGNQCRSV
jgi:YIF1